MRTSSVCLSTRSMTIAINQSFLSHHTYACNHHTYVPGIPVGMPNSQVHFTTSFMLKYAVKNSYYISFSTALKLSISVTDFPHESIPTGAEHPLVHAILLFLRKIPFGAIVAHISHHFHQFT